MSSSKKERLLQAAIDGDIEVIKEIIESTTHPIDNIVYEFGTGQRIQKHPLFHIVSSRAKKNKYEILSYLLEKGANINVKTGAGFTSLHHAVSNDDKELVLFLLKNGADPEIVANALTPLLLAIQLNEYDPELLQFLIDNGVSPDNYIGDYKVTPLYFAAKKGCLKCVQVLLAAKADLLKSQEGDKNMIQRAQEGQFTPEIAREILDLSRRRNRAFERRKHILAYLPSVAHANKSRKRSRHRARGTRRRRSG